MRIKQYFKGKGFIILLIIYILAFIGDIVTTAMNGELVKHLEINPIYNLTGTLWSPILLNIFIIGIIYWIYRKQRTTPALRFLLINSMVITILIRIYAIQNAIYWIRNPITPEQAAAYVTPAMITASLLDLAWLTYLPLFLSIISFFFWKLDHEVKRI